MLVLNFFFESDTASASQKGATGASSTGTVTGTAVAASSTAVKKSEGMSWGVSVRFVVVGMGVCLSLMSF